MPEISDFHRDTIDTIKQNIEAGELHLSIIIPTGLGKTHMLAVATKEFLSKRGSTVIIERLAIMAKQSKDIFNQVGAVNFETMSLATALKHQEKLETAANIILLDIYNKDIHKLSRLEIDFSDKVVLSAKAIMG